jgi:hypothetical protein
MSDHLVGTEQYRLKIDECIKMAKGSTSNKLRAHHYARAEHLWRLFEAEVNQVGDSTSRG